MKTFRLKKYEIFSSKIKEKEVRLAFLTDLHGLEFGEKNRELIQAVRAFSPDAVLSAGDLIIRGIPETFQAAESLLIRLAEEFPVCCSLGNHEYKVLEAEEYKDMREMYEEYEDRLKKAGISVLHNEKKRRSFGKNQVSFYGLELPLCYYYKPKSPVLTREEMEGFVGEPDKGVFSVLLAHNPKYGNAYFSWGADLILSGHYHGGVVRLGENTGLISPQLHIFPPFCCGKFKRGEQHMLVSAGLGEHTIPVRIHNPRELLLITVKPLEKSCSSM